MQVGTKRAILGGIVGTAIMSLMMMYVAPVMTGRPMDIAEMLGGMLGGYIMGLVAHLMMGIIVFPLAYAFVAYRFLPGAPVVRGLAWGIILWVVAVVVVMPMAGAGVLMANVGGMAAVGASMMGHLVYGGLLGAIAGNGTTT